jgi:hypothetical protein
MQDTNIEYYPADYDWHSHFQNVRLVRGFEGGAVYTALDAGRPVLISDEGTVLEMLGEADLRNAAVSVRRFATEEERDEYIHRYLPPEAGAPGRDPSPGGISASRIDAAGATAAPARQPLDAFKLAARARQAAFRATLPVEARTSTDEPWARYDFLLALGYEDETLYPTLRGAGGARDYFSERGARWWRSPATGDAKGDGPTRNLTSSQVACANLLLPLREKPELLTAMLRVLDPTIETVVRIESSGADGRPLSSFVELEWTGREGTLEGRGSRGAHATSADACLVGVTAAGQRKAFLLEFKYTESYTRDASKGMGEKGANRKALYAERYGRSSSCFSGVASLDDVLYDPFYQIVRLGLLGDAMLEDRALDLAHVAVAVVCPSENTAYRERVTSPALRRLFPGETTVAGVARHLWKRPEGFHMVEPRQLVEAVHAAGAEPELERWSGYMRDRYGW